MNNLEYIILSIKEFVKEALCTIKFFLQRFFRGWDDRETWDLEYEFIKWIFPRLKRFTKISVAYPPQFTEKEWAEFLNKIIQKTENFIVKYENMDELSLDEQEELYTEKTKVARILSDHLEYFSW